MGFFIHQSAFVLRFRYLIYIGSSFRKIWLCLLGFKIGKGTHIPPIFITWPHQVRIGNNCKLEQNICFKYDGIWKKGPSIQIGDFVFIGSCCEFNIAESISIGNNTLIASGCRFIDHDHGKVLGQLLRVQKSEYKSIIIGSDVWLGCNVVVLKGVMIGPGAIVGAGSIVTRSIPMNEVWAGIPAKKIGVRNTQII